MDIGRLGVVWEDPSHFNYLTTYTYGADNTLQKVTQGSQTRSFTYDTLGRMISSAQPESGTVGYTYDNVGNLWTRTDARGTQANYYYDALNRVTLITYSDTTPGWTFNYDAGGGTATGQLTSV